MTCYPDHETMLLLTTVTSLVIMTVHIARDLQVVQGVLLTKFPEHHQLVHIHIVKGKLYVTNPGVLNKHHSYIFAFLGETSG